MRDLNDILSSVFGGTGSGAVVSVELDDGTSFQMARIVNTHEFGVVLEIQWTDRIGPTFFYHWSRIRKIGAAKT